MRSTTGTWCCSGSKAFIASNCAVKLATWSWRTDSGRTSEDMEEALASLGWLFGLAALALAVDFAAVGCTGFSLRMATIGFTFSLITSMVSLSPRVTWRRAASLTRSPRSEGSPPFGPIKVRASASRLLSLASCLAAATASAWTAFRILLAMPFIGRACNMPSTVGSSQNANLRPMRPLRCMHSPRLAIVNCFMATANLKWRFEITPAETCLRACSNHLSVDDVEGYGKGKKRKKGLCKSQSRTPLAAHSMRSFSLRNILRHLPACKPSFGTSISHRCPWCRPGRRGRSRFTVLWRRAHWSCLNRRTRNRAWHHGANQISNMYTVFCEQMVMFCHPQWTLTLETIVQPIWCRHLQLNDAILSNPTPTLRAHTWPCSRNQRQ